MGASVRDIPGRFCFHDNQLVEWDPEHSSSSDGFVECPHQRGLWLCRGAMPRRTCEDIAAFASAACGGDAAVREPHSWAWHGYDPSRRVAPVLLDSSPKAAAQLCEFEVFGGEAPERWLRAAHFARHPDAAVRRGARKLVSLPRRARSLVPRSAHDLAGEMSLVQFLQLQALQRGAEIRPHIDAATPPADVVATLGVTGTARILVGAVETVIREGDLYLLAGAARWERKHEVLAAESDRLTVTTRFFAACG